MVERRKYYLQLQQLGGKLMQYYFKACGFGRLAEKQRQKGREMEEKCVGLAEKERHKAREMEELYVKIEIRRLGVL